MKRLLVGGLAALALALGLGAAPTAHADAHRDVCLAVMALYVNPNDGSGEQYTAYLMNQYGMTYGQARDLVARAYASVQWHANPMCNGITIPPNY